MTTYTNSTATNGQIVGRFDYDDFGNSITLSGQPANVAVTVIQYTGQMWDSGQGKYYLRNRIYDPATGRFLSYDPTDIGAGELVDSNKYLYAGGNPVMYDDPSGHDGELAELEISIGVGASIDSANAISTVLLGAEEGAGAAEAATEYNALLESEIEEATGEIPESVAQLQDAQNELVETQQSNLQQAIEENGATGRGEHFNQLGEDWEDITDKTLNEAAPDATVRSGQSVGNGPGSQLDHVVQQGDTKVFVEDKYSLPQDGSSLTRAANQMNNGANALSPNDTLILNVARAANGG